MRRKGFWITRTEGGRSEAAGKVTPPRLFLPAWEITHHGLGNWGKDVLGSGGHRGIGICPHPPDPGSSFSLPKAFSWEISCKPGVSCALGEHLQPWGFPRTQPRAVQLLPHRTRGWVGEDGHVWGVPRAEAAPGRSQPHGYREQISVGCPDRSIPAQGAALPCSEVSSPANLPCKVRPLEILWKKPRRDQPGHEAGRENRGTAPSRCK